MKLILLQVDVHKKKKKKKKKKKNSSLQSGRNVVSQLTLTYSLIAVVSFETKCVFVYRHSALIVFVVKPFRFKMRTASGPESVFFFIHHSVKQNVSE